MKSFYENPFALLGATPHDTKQRIISLAEDKSLVLDGELCNKARSDLTGPRRVIAEIAWLPGLLPKRATELVNLLRQNPDLIHSQSLNTLPTLAKANLLAAAFQNLNPEMSTEQWIEKTLDLAYAIEEIDLNEMLANINADRKAGGWPEVKNLSLIDDGFKDHRRSYQETVKESLNRLPTLKLVEIITVAAETTTELGDEIAPSLLEELVDDYQSKSRNFIEAEAKNILKLAEQIGKLAAKGWETILPLINRLEQVLLRWDKIAQPIQVIVKSRGETHDTSEQLARDIRSLAIDLFNKHGLLDEAARINKILQQVFAELPDMIERLEQDSNALEEINNQRQEEKHQQKWMDDLTRILDSFKSKASQKQSLNTLLDQLSVILRQGHQLGLPDELRLALAHAVRSVGIDLFNNHELLEESERIISMLRNAFSDLPELRKSLDDDTTAIKRIRTQREQAKRQEQEWRESITFKADIGLIFKDTLSISPNGVQWKSMSFPLDQVTRIRWGGVSHSLNGIPTGTDYTIYFGNQHQLAKILINKSDIFQTFIDKLWRAVGVRLMTEMLEGLRNGRQYKIGDALISDLGVEVTKHGFFSNSRVYGNWPQLKTWSANGLFFIGIASDAKAYSELSYIDTDNTHIIEAAIRMKLKNKSQKLSSILE